VSIEWLATIRAQVEHFAEKNLQQAPALRKRLMEIKRTHTRHVAADARLIAERGGQAALAAVAEAAGWLHDVARFPQVLEHGHFDDHRSRDHGDWGAELLIRENLLGPAGPEQQRALQNAVRFHNKKALPENLPEPDLSLLKILRDADRLDIYRVIAEAVESGEIHKHPELHLDCSPQQSVNPRLLEQFMRGEPLYYRDAHSMFDMQILKLSWVYQMHCPISLQLFRERHLLDRIVATLPDHPVKAQLIEAALAHMETS